MCSAYIYMLLYNSIGVAKCYCKMYNFKSLFLWVLILVLQQQSTTAEEANAEVQLEITTIPSGPVFMASTWIRFACKATNHSQPETLRYEWRGFSPDAQGNQTLLADDPLLDGDRSAFVWILSTSDVQYVECSVISGSTVLEVAGMDINVTGAGVHFKNSFLSSVANNTAVVNTGNNDHILICQSALRNWCNAGNWNIDGDSTVAARSQVCDSLEVFTTAQLSLSPSLISGLYACLIPDETLLTRKVFIGVYSNLEEKVIPFKSSMMLTHQVDFDNKLSLSCSTRELPGSLAVWRRNSIILSPSETVTSRISVVNVSSVLYDSELILEWTGSGVSLVNCLVHSEWLTPGDNFYTPESASGNFVIIELGASAGVQCTQAANIAQVQWLDEDGQTLDTSQFPGLDISGNIISIADATASLNGVSFQCRGLDSNGNVQVWQHYSIIVSVPPELAVVSLADNYTSPVVQDEPHDIICCYNTTDAAVPVTIQWYRDTENIEYMRDPNLQVTVENECSTLHFTRVGLEEDGRRYKCRVETDSPLLYTARTALNLAEVTLSVNERVTTVGPDSTTRDITTDDAAITASASNVHPLPMSLVVVVLLCIGSTFV